MIIVCDSCKTRFRVDEDTIRREVFKAKCAKCDHVFTVHKHPPADEPLVLEQAQVVSDLPPRIITICNQKGGVAKTSSCINLAAALASQGKKVLMVDFDVQANLTELLGCGGESCFFDVMQSDQPDQLSRSVLKVGNNLWCLPSNSRMALLSKKYINTKGFEKILRGHLERIAGVFDHVFIDTPPSLDFFTLNALMASDFAIIPTQAEFLAVKGVRHVENIIDVLGEKTGHKIGYKVLITMYDQQNIAARVIKGNLEKALGTHIFRTTIVHDRKVQESQIVRKALIDYAPNSTAAQQYLAVAGEVLGGARD